MIFEPFFDKPHPNFTDGTWQVYLFENRYAASVIRAGYGENSFTGSYGVDDGLFELAVMKCRTDADPRQFSSYGLCYDTPITDDVVGYLTEEDVQELLAKVASLPNQEPAS